MNIFSNRQPFTVDIKYTIIAGSQSRIDPVTAVKKTSLDIYDGAVIEKTVNDVVKLFDSQITSFVYSSAKGRQVLVNNIEK